MVVEVVGKERRAATLQSRVSLQYYANVLKRMSRGRKVRST